MKSPITQQEIDSITALISNGTSVDLAFNVIAHRLDIEPRTIKAWYDKGKEVYGSIRDNIIRKKDIQGEPLLYYNLYTSVSAAVTEYKLHLENNIHNVISTGEERVTYGYNSDGEEVATGRTVTKGSSYAGLIMKYQQQRFPEEYKPGVERIEIENTGVDLNELAEKLDMPVGELAEKLLDSRDD